MPAPAIASVTRAVLPLLAGLMTLVAVGPAVRGQEEARLRPVEVRRDPAGLEGLLNASAVALSPEGRHLYVTGLQLAGGGGGSLVVLERDATNGKLAFVEVQRDGFGSVTGIGGGRAVVVSPDGAHVYVTGSYSGGIAAFSRNPTTGQLTFVALERAGDAALVDFFPTALALSPDGRLVYATGGNGMVVFTRDRISGRLLVLETKIDGVDGVGCLAGPQGVAVSPDGDHVYVTAADDNALAVFARDPTTGRSQLVECLRHSGDRRLGLAGASAVVASPDGNHVYVASRWHDWLVGFARDPRTGRLTFVERQRNGAAGVYGLSLPAQIAISADGERVYVTGSRRGTLVAFARRPANGRLRFEQVLVQGRDGVDGLAGAEGLVVSADGLHTYVAGSYSNAIAVFTAAPEVGRLGLAGPATGVVGQVLRFTASAADCAPAETWDWTSDGGVRSGDGATRSITWASPGMKTVTVRNTGCTGGDATVAVDVRGGALQTLTVVRQGTGAAAGRLRSGPSGIDCGGGSSACTARFPADTVIRLNATASPGGTVAWGSGCRGGRLTLGADRSCRVTFGAVPLAQIGLWRDGVDGVDGLALAWSVAVSPDGAFVYALGLFDSGVAVFGREASTGELRFVALESEPVGSPYHTLVAVSPDGAHLYVLADDVVLVFSRDAASGRLTFVAVVRDGEGGVSGLGLAEGLAMSPDGAHLYVTGRLTGVVVFARDVASGNLRFVQALEQGVGGIDGLDDPTGIAISPDGAEVYVAAFQGHSLATFGRDPATGRLTFLGSLHDGEGGAVGLVGAWGVAVSPDGANVYVSSYSENSVAVFARDPATGLPAFVEIERDVVDGVDGLDWPSGIVVSPDGSRLYVSAHDESAVGVFARAPASGRLDYLGVLHEGIEGVTGLGGALAVALSPDGRHLYVTGSDTDTLAAFAVIDGQAP